MERELYPWEVRSASAPAPVAPPPPVTEPEELVIEEVVEEPAYVFDPED